MTTVTNEYGSTAKYYAGDGSTTARAWNGPLYNRSDLKVYVVDANGVDTLQVLDTDYTVTLAGDFSSATVTMTTASPTGSTDVLVLDAELHQEDTYPTGTKFPVATLQDQLNRIALQLQAHQEQIDRSLKLPATVDKATDGVSVETPKPSANKLLRYNSLATAVELYDPSELGNFSFTYGSINIDVFIDGTDYTSGTTTQLTLSSDPATENNTEIYFDGLYQEKDTYSVSGTVITFSTAIPPGTNQVEVKHHSVLDIGTPADGTVNTNKLASSAVTPAKIDLTAIFTFAGVTNTKGSILSGKATVIGAGGSPDATADGSKTVYLLDGTSANCTLNLDASPADGAFYFVKSIDSTNTVTIGRNAKNIDGAASDITLATNAGVVLSYDQTLGSWYKLADV